MTCPLARFLVAIGSLEARTVLKDFKLIARGPRDYERWRELSTATCMLWLLGAEGLCLASMVHVVRGFAPLRR